jgi:hypothetical protein
MRGLAEWQERWPPAVPALDVPDALSEILQVQAGAHQSERCASALF